MVDEPTPARSPRRSRTALVLSGGGVRGAYEAGVVAGIVEALGLSPGDESPFAIFAGTSVGAINATYLAAGARRGDLAVAGLIDLWTSLRLDVHLSFKLRELISVRRLLARVGVVSPAAPSLGWSLLDAAPLERLVGDGVAWSALRDNVRDGTVRALIVAALEVASGRTTMFAELGAGVNLSVSKDPLWAIRETAITPDHVLASAAIPLLFPARRLGEAYYCDGGLRFNTPLAPAIRVGATRLVVVSVLRAERATSSAELGYYPDVAFLAGKVFNALLADPIAYDLQVLERFNRLMEVAERSLAPADLKRVEQVLVETRGARYQRLDTLVFRPSRNIGLMAGEHLRNGGHRDGHGVQGWVMTQLLRRSRSPEADWASYLLFDGDFAAELIELGRKDARARADDIRRFFAPPPA